MSKATKITILTLLPMMFCGCNNHVFVDPVPDIEESVSLSGDNGSVKFKIPKKGLVSVDFDNDVDYDATASYYDSKGEIIYSPKDIGEVARVLYSSHRFAMEFNVNDDEVKVTALDNAYPTAIDIRANLYYGYTTRTVTFHISPGRPLEIEYLGHDISKPSVSIVTESGLGRRFNNNTGRVLRMEIYPYREATSKLTLTPEEPWTDGVSGVVPVPSYVLGEWNDFYPTDVDVTIGVTTNFQSVNALDEVAYIEVPPNSSVVAELTVTYATLDTNYLATIVLPNSRLSWNTEGTWKLRQPISYDINVTQAE
ncbi:MAG: hypothetical protein NC453_28365 [Muribaculum sp.]|nr:hypothetical protein [Muribaculum sp.]